jgi:hypothetical protein
MKARAGPPVPTAGDGRRTNELTRAGARRQIVKHNAPPLKRLPLARLRRLTQQIHRLGERPLYELLRELEAWGDFQERVEAYARLDPGVVAALGADELPSLRSLDGGKQ